jgi:preprotein translocase subunit Sec61beta
LYSRHNFLAPAPRRSPATVLSMSLIFIGIVVALHILGKFNK